MTAYHDGRRVEYAVTKDTRRNGYRIIRGSGSKGFADVVAIKPGQQLYINCKKTDMPDPAERAELIESASWVGALPLVALKPKGQGMPTYYRLTGPGPKDWVPWTPDQIGRPVKETTK